MDMPCSSTPVVRPRQALQRFRVAFQSINAVGNHDTSISVLNHTAYPLAVYASQRRLPDATQDSLPAGG